MLFLVSLILTGQGAWALEPWPHEAPQQWGLAIIDVETTGLDPGHHEMVDLGAIYVTLAGEELGRFFVRIMPEHPQRAGKIARSMNGFSEARWQALDAVSPAQAVQRFLAFHASLAEDRRFIFTAYNAPFDRGFINALLRRHDSAFDQLYLYFTLDLPSMAFGAGQIALRNADVAAAYGLPPETDDPLEHTGLSGAEWNLALYRAMLQAGHG
ncbi:MAG: exonuclease domain-containing protein, partial [Wenzhouxiangella sp.]